jgi:hypothetical protein
MRVAHGGCAQYHALKKGVKKGINRMLEKLEGRLKWDRTPEGILISIPVRRGASTAGYAALVLIWLTIASIHYWHLFTGPRLDAPGELYQLIAIAIYIIGFMIFICWITWTATGETILFLDAKDMKIQQRILGIELASRSFPTRDVHSFNYVRPKQFWALRANTDPSSSRIRFTVHGKYHYFARGVSEAEAFALVERMVEIHRFPGSGEQYWGAVAR